MSAPVEPAASLPPARPPRRWFQWSLRTLLLAMTILAIGPGGWIVLERQRMQREAAVVAKFPLGTEVYARESWLWTLLAGRSTGPVVGLATRNTRPAERQKLGVFSELVWLDLTEPNVTDADLPPLASLRKLERLRLDETQVTSAGLAPLASLPRLHTLNLQRTAVDDACLEQLAAMPRLNDLFLQKTAVTDAGIRQLRQSRPQLVLDR